DSWQGTGFSGFEGSVTTREATRLSYDVDGLLGGQAGTLAVWFQPRWAGAAGRDHVLLDAGGSEGRNRVRLSKNADDRMVLSVYDSDAELLQVVSDETADFAEGDWLHLACTWDAGTLKLFAAGSQMSTIPVGTGS